METVDNKLIEITDSVFIDLGTEYPFPFTKVYRFPLTPESYLAHIKISEKMAPFYFLFNEFDRFKPSLKGYTNSWFIPNLFKIGYDKNNKMYLRCDINNPRYSIKHHSIRTVDDYKMIEHLIDNKHFIFEGYEAEEMDVLFEYSEAIELIKI